MVDLPSPSVVAHGATAAADAAPLSILLHRERGGPVIAEQPVFARDLADSLAELWFETELRRGARQHPLSELEAQVRTVFREDTEIGRYCAGYELVADRDGQAISRFFDRSCLAPVATRCADALLAEGQLEKGDLYFYGLADADQDAPVRGPEGRGLPSFAAVPLAPLLQRAEPVEAAASDRNYPVFFTREAHALAERISRRGGDANPPVETGGILTGSLCACPESGEIFSVVEDVLEATDSDATTYSLAYSGRTWSRIQTVLRARTRQADTRFHRALGQCHGHNFQIAPETPPCEACHLLPVCTRNSATLSPEDRTWARAVFPCEPWQLSQVFGLDAKTRGVEAFYGQRGGSLKRRGYYLIDHFEAAGDPA